MRQNSILLTVLVALALPGQALAIDRGATRGAEWLRTHAARAGDGAAADALIALRAGGRLSAADASARARALRRGWNYSRTAGGPAKVVLGLRASGVGNPRCAGRNDLLAAIGRGRRGGRYRGNVYDQTLAMIAMRTLNAGPSRASVRTLIRARGGGGWNLRMTRGTGDSVSSTAMAILALRGAGVSSRNTALRSAHRWLLSRRTASGGFTEEGGRAQANATALAIRATLAMGYRDPRAVRALRSLQAADGSFLLSRTDSGSRLLATNDAVLALAGRTLPTGGLSRTPGPCR
ncbi:MAG: hypothetical protein V9E83_00850 [Baekduia sp.]